MNITALKNSFNDIKNLRENSINLMKSLADKIETLKVIYNQLMVSNIDETETGLDSFYFQTKLINLELENYQNTFKIIENRIYGDYYKLFKKATKFLSDNEYILTLNKNIVQQFQNKEYEVFKDLNDIHNYDFNSTCDIYNDIIQVIDILHNELLEREHKLDLQKIKKQSGLYIDNLIAKVSFNNKYINNHIYLFNENVEIFNNFHKKYLTRFLLKIKLFYGQINIDIKIEESKNSIDYKIEEPLNISLEDNEEDEIRNLINTSHSISPSNSDENIITDTNLNIMNELNCMISSISDTSSNSYSFGKNDNDEIISGISTPHSYIEDTINNNNNNNNNNSNNNNSNNNDDSNNNNKIIKNIEKQIDIILLSEKDSNDNIKSQEKLEKNKKCIDYINNLIKSQHCLIL